MKYTANKAWWSFTCGKCEAECEAEPSDVKGNPHRDIDGDIVAYIPIVPCGRCGNEVRVPEEKLTPLIFTLANQNPTKNNT